MTTQISLPDYFEIEEALGQGSLSTVLHARDRRTDRAIAVKALRPVVWLEETEAAARRRRCEESLRPLTSLRHPNLAAVHEIGTYDDTFFVARESVRGISLRSLLQERGTLSLYEARWLAAQIADGMDALADAGFSHGALTTENVFVESNGLVRVTDAGFSRAASGLSLAGTSCHLHTHAAPANDLAALAALTFKMLTGFWPLHRDGTISRAYNLPPAARDALDCALIGGRGGFRSAAEFAEALVPISHPTLFRLVWRPSAAVGLLGALATIGGYAFPEQPAVKTVPPVPAVSAATPTAPSPLLPGPGRTDAVPARAQGEPIAVEAKAPALRPLSDEDRQTLQLAIRRQGAATLAHPAVADLFGLSEQQRAAIADCLAEQRERVGMIVSAAADGAMTDTGAAMQALRETTTVRILMLLDDTQRARWQSLTNAPLAPDEPVL